MEALFKLGDTVCLQADPDRVGPVISVRPGPAGVFRYLVFHDKNRSQEYDEHQLRAVATAGQTTPVVTAVLERNWLDPELFRARLAVARLLHPQVDSLYSLQAARIRYVPFQFKPLLRLLNSDRPRLLIADEVGVGKTIEAGLILRELQSRQELDRVLIVCPKALVSKWRAEMRRFDENFRPLTADSLRYCLKETELAGAWPVEHSRAIGHLELLRGQDYLEGTTGRHARKGFLTLDPPPRFDLVIVDEAHHVRTSGTSSHKLAHLLCEVSDAVIFLSATPVQLGAGNLYSLLNLLRPDLFEDATVFSTMLEPNRFITAAMRHVRHESPAGTWMSDAREALAQAAGTTWGARVLCQDPRFIEWADRLSTGRSLDQVERVRCVRDLEELHTLAGVMNRTRRRDVGPFTQREPHTISVAFTPSQAKFYEALIEHRRRSLLERYDPLVVRLILDTLERQASSCLPALAETIEAMTRAGRLDTAFLNDGAEDESDDDAANVALPAGMDRTLHGLGVLARALPPEDPKFDRLIDLVRTTLRSTGPGKVLVFSFFLHTLGYLERRLRQEGIRVALISGRSRDEEREDLRARFRAPREEPESLDVLLSSEVGCEGLDYEFCDRLVNYDIPWNPMRIEQRIGRIDRFGQKSPKVMIYNFITPGTVEERIFFRCFERLGVFRDTVGDLEEVLGQITHDLTKIASDSTLTAEQAEALARQSADNSVRRIEEGRRVEDEGGSLLGVDQTAMDEIDSLRSSGKFVSPDDLRSLVALFLRSDGLGGGLSPSRAGRAIERLSLRQASRIELAERVKALGRDDARAVEFLRLLGTQEEVLLTFDPETASERRDIPFVTPVHPLARAAVEHWRGSPTPMATALAVESAELPAGRYVFVCDLWESIGVRAETRLVVMACDLTRAQPAPVVADGLLAALPRAVRFEGNFDSTAVQDAFARLDEEAYGRRQDEIRHLRSRDEVLVRQRLESLRSYYANRIDVVARQRNAATEARIKTMKEFEERRIIAERDARCGELEGRREADVIDRRIAAGVLEVIHAH